MLTEAEITRLAQHLVNHLGAKHIHVSSIRRFHGGASRETYGLDIEVDGTPQGIIVRRDPVASLINTERALEFAAYASFEGGDVPVPKVICLVEDPSVIGAPFFVMERIDGGKAESAFDMAAYGDLRASIGKEFFTLLGRIGARDAASSPLADVTGLPAPDECWRQEIDYWESVLDKDELEPHPIARAAIRWLHRTPPPPAERLSVVHGDYRNGNVMHDGEGQIIAVLDWEMAHIGDAHEDLAWALDPMWNLQDPSRAAGLIPRDQAIRLWERESGLRFDAATFRWWEMFATVKGLVIWISAAKAFVDGSNSDPILAFSGIYPLARANALLAERLGGAS
jgi:aminoglycoside phosphotransferase (APT) family kinase protein